MLSKKIVATLCFVCFILHSIYLVWNNSSNNKSVSNSKFEDLTRIPFPLKVQVIVDPGMVSGFDAELQQFISNQFSRLQASI